MRRSSQPRAKRQKLCKVCRESFRPFTSTQVVCSPDCALVWVKVIARKGKSTFEKALRSKYRADKERIKPRSKVMAEAQAAFNAFIRLRDDGEPCISCGRYNPPDRHGGAWDCGHYLTRGAHPELRFNEDNAHKQCKKCNGGAGFSFGGAKSKTVQQAYREHLGRKIGQDKVEWLDGPHEPRLYRIDELREIKATYQRKRRELKALIAAK